VRKTIQNLPKWMKATFYHKGVSPPPDPVKGFDRSLLGWDSDTDEESKGDPSESKIIGDNAPGPYVCVQDLIADVSELSAGDCRPLPERLAEWGLVLDDTLKILICVSCGHALRPTYDAFYAHIKSKHGAISPELQCLLRTATETFSFGSTEDVCTQPSGRAPIQGIKIQAGFYCPVVLPGGSPCQYTAGKVDTLYQHLCNDHRDNPKRLPKDSLGIYGCEYQTVFAGADRRLFRVQTGLADVNCSSPYSVFLDTIDRMATPDVRPPERIKDDEIPSFLRGTRWHIFMEPYRAKPKDVVALVAYPESRGGEMEKVLSRLTNISNAWMKKVHGNLLGSSDYIKRMLGQFPM